MQALCESSLFPLVSSRPCSFPYGALDRSSLSAALRSPPLSVRRLHNALQFAGNLQNTHLVHPLCLWPAVSHADLLLLGSSLWPSATTIAPMRVSGRRYLARKKHYTVRCNPLPNMQAIYIYIYVYIYIYIYDNPDTVDELKVKEIKNGRLVMFSVSNYYV